MTYVDPQDPEKTAIAGDNFYADVDNDGLPDLALGRIPALTDAEVDRVLKKIIAYEQIPVVGPWNRRINLFAAPGDYGRRLDKLIEHLALELLDTLSYDFDVTVLYGAPGSPATVPPEEFSDRVYELVNEGSLFTVFLGHGRPQGPQTGWWQGRSFHVWNMAQLGRKLHMRHRPPILLFVACLMGAFMDRQSISETLLFTVPGPPALVAATGRSHPYANAILVREMGALATGRLVHTVGELLRRAKRLLMTGGDAVRLFIDTLASAAMRPPAMARLRRSHLYLYNLLGDPALRIGHPRGHARVTTPGRAPGAVHPGQTVPVEIAFDTLATGTARVTLEARRSVILGTLRPLPRRGRAARNRALRANYRVTNNKVATAQDTQIVAGRARTLLQVPVSLPAGTYYIKVYARDDRREAIGHRRIEIEK